MRDKTLKLLDTIINMKKRGTRPIKPLRDPEAQYTEDWHMCVPKCFNDSLDIRKTERVSKGEKTLQWTQGSTFSFETGDVLYDTRKAYEPWPEAMKHINCCIQVREASQAIPGEKKSKNKPGTPRNSGIVTFDILVPDQSRTKLVKEKDKIEMKQDEFVRFLISGMPTRDSEPPARDGELF